MPAYETTSFEPPAPVAQVTVRSAKTGESASNVGMLIDTGANVTLLPRPPIVSLLDATDDGEQYELEGFDGTRSLASVVRLELHFLGRVFRGQFLLIDQNHGILGRNLLNAIPLVLDGPKLEWQVRQLDEATCRSVRIGVPDRTIVRARPPLIPSITPSMTGAANHSWQEYVLV